MEYKELDKVNKELLTTDIKGKNYVEVNQRILAFRKLFENGAITTELIELKDGICTIKANVYDNEGKLISTGHAQEKEGSTFINKTSYIENCETSAVGRALGILGIGATTSIASAEEVQNAINNQAAEMLVDDLKYTIICEKLAKIPEDARTRALAKYNYKDAKEVQLKNFVSLSNDIDTYIRIKKKKKKTKGE